MYAVSNRQISEAANQGNNAAACYHFGTRTDLLRAIEAKHRGPIEELRSQMLARIAGSTDLRDWVGALVLPADRSPGRAGHPELVCAVRGAGDGRPQLPPRGHEGRTRLARTRRKRWRASIVACPTCPSACAIERIVMARNLLMHTCAEHEGELAEHGPAGAVQLARRG